MQKWWNWLLAFSLCCLLFISIPLMLSREPTAEELKPMFDDYIQKFNKSYADPQEYETRFQHFVSSVREIQKLNAGSRGPDSCRAKYGLTKLSDMSPTEFQEIHLSDERVRKPPRSYGKSWSQDSGNSDYYKYHTDHEHSDHQRDRPCSSESHDNIYIIIRKKRMAVPLKVDWRTKGVIGPVRNQGLCGACWAFSTVGVIEAMSAIKTGKMETLSVQEVIDCAGLGNSGCAGGDICLLLDWLMITDTGVQKDKQYPLSLSNGVCKTNNNATGVRVESFTCDESSRETYGDDVVGFVFSAMSSSFVRSFVGSENKILQALAVHGPVAVAVNALIWQHYLGGVIQFHCSGAPMDLNHAVELVGYDLTAEVPHYIAKNSWGTEFGNDGYVNLAIGSNICGLANEVASVAVK